VRRAQRSKEIFPKNFSQRREGAEDAKLLFVVLAFYLQDLFLCGGTEGAEGFSQRISRRGAESAEDAELLFVVLAFYFQDFFELIYLVM
jgi:hypothetical protein